MSFRSHISSRGHSSPKTDLAELLGSACPCAHEDIGTAEQHVKAVQVLPDPAVHGLTEFELPLNDQKGVFDHTPDGRFSVFDLPLVVAESNISL